MNSIYKLTSSIAIQGGPESVYSDN